MRIRCLITRSFLARYVDGELGVTLNRRVQAHLSRCSKCRGRARETQLVGNRIRAFDAPAVTGGEWQAIWNGVLRRVEREEGVAPVPHDTIPFQQSRWRGRYALIGAAAILLVAGAVLRLVVADNSTQQTAISSYIQYHEDAVDGHVLLENHFWNAQVLPVSYRAGK